MWRKLIVTGIVLFVILGYFLFPGVKDVVTNTPTPTPENSIDTSDWKTYAIDKYGVSFKYPPQYSSIEVDNNPEPYDMEYMVVFRDNEQPYDKKLGTFSFLLRLESLDELYSNVLDLTEIVSEDKVTVGGLVGVEIEDLDLDQSRTDQYTSHAIHVYIEYMSNRLISVGGGIDTDSENRDGFLNMVRTMITTLSIEKTVGE